jgi:hypothetical protein
VRVTKNAKAVSKIVFILLLILFMVISSIFTYLIVAGYYLNLGTGVPETTTLSIKEVSFDTGKPGTFDLTVLNPTYSPTSANITQIYVITEDDTIYTIATTSPTLPSIVAKGKEATFSCTWNWADYSDELVKVVVIVADGSGSVYETEVAPVKMTISPLFSVADTKHFNITLNNLEGSALDLTVNKVTVTLDNGTERQITQITPSIPKEIVSGGRQAFNCTWDWAQYRERSVTITVNTEEGFVFTKETTTPDIVQIVITDINFDNTDFTSFQVTVKNTETSISSADISTVQLFFENGTLTEVPIHTPTTPYNLPIGESVTLTCTLNWEQYRGETVSVSVETPEGYYGYNQLVLP